MYKGIQLFVPYIFKIIRVFQSQGIIFNGKSQLALKIEPSFFVQPFWPNSLRSQVHPSHVKVSSYLKRLNPAIIKNFYIYLFYILCRIRIGYSHLSGFFHLLVRSTQIRSLLLAVKVRRRIWSMPPVESFENLKTKSTLKP